MFFIFILVQNKGVNDLFDYNPQVDAGALTCIQKTFELLPLWLVSVPAQVQDTTSVTWHMKHVKNLCNSSQLESSQFN